MKNIQLYNDDCFNVFPSIEDGSVDMVLCDLPYGTTACSWDFVLPMDELWKQYNRICKENAAMVFTASQPFTSNLIYSNIKNFRYEWIWQKPQGTNPLTANIMPLKNHENILVFYRKTPTYNPQMEIGKPYSSFSDENKKLGEVFGDRKSQHRDNPDGTRFPKSVLNFKQEREGLHPTQKPVALMQYLIKTYSNEGDCILDNTMGSGTTGVAAMITNRKFIGVEKEEKYFLIAKERMNEPRNRLIIIT
jgi:site-specific DNA-methyltransferase (adenine-specific)